jgi:hypothetical protein
MVTPKPACFSTRHEDEVKRRFSRTSDFGQNRSSTSESGRDGSQSKSGREGGFLWWGGQDVESKSTWYNKNYSQDTTNFKVSTTQSEDSTAKVDLHAKLGGKVHVNFKSETFPLDRMVDVLQVDQIREKTLVPATPVSATPGQQTAQPPATPGK